MKKLLLPLTCVLIFCALSTQKASAFIRIPSGEYEKIKKISDFPDEEDYEYEVGKYFDLGILYTVYKFAGIPLYQVGETRIVGYIDSPTSCVLLKEHDLERLGALNNIENWDSFKELPFWDAWGGKIVGAGILFLLIFFSYYGKVEAKE